MDSTRKHWVAEEFNGICAIKGCDLSVVRAGLCNKHWRRNKKFGSPIWLEKPAASYRGMEPLARMLTRVTKTDTCWLWTGNRDYDGYGLFYADIGGVLYKKAHRFSWAYHNNAQIPADKEIMHVCDVRNCVNPDHLRLGTNLENQADKVAKGRHRSNPTPAAKVNADVVRLIRASTMAQVDLANRYGLTQGTISDIQRRKTWRHI